jgi:hypothetical protein
MNTALIPLDLVMTILGVTASMATDTTVKWALYLVACGCLALMYLIVHAIFDEAIVKFSKAGQEPKTSAGVSASDGKGQEASTVDPDNESEAVRDKCRY